MVKPQTIDIEISTIYTISIKICVVSTFSVLKVVIVLKEQTCCFTGHRTIPLGMERKLFCVTEEIVEKAIKDGYRYFGAGGALGFDTIAALVVLKLKKHYPDIKLILVLPCLTQTQGWKNKDVEIYEDIKKRADKVVYTSQRYVRGCMHKRNRHLVDNSSLCICYYTKEIGGTHYTVNYAYHKLLKVLNIAELL